VLARLGANLVLTPGPRACGAHRRAEAAAAAEPIATSCPSNSKNPPIPCSRETTGPENLEGHRRAIDRRAGFGRGTGGTITGVSRYIKKTKKKAITSVAANPPRVPS